MQNPVGGGLPPLNMDSRQKLGILNSDHVAVPRVNARPPKRTLVLSDVPTIAESALPGYEYIGAIGLSAPAATPREFVNRLNAAIFAVVNKPELREAIGKSGFEAQTSSSEQFTASVRDDIAKIEAVVKGAGLQAD